MPPTSKQGTDMAELFAGLDIQPSAEPLPEVQRTRASIPNPFAEPLHASVNAGTAYSIYVPEDAVNRAVFLINAAARKENLGVRIVVNVQRDEKGALVKNDKGKTIPVPETRGPNKGKVLVRFQGKPERKQPKAPRPFSIVKDPDNPTGKALRERASGQIVARGTHDEMRAENKRRKEAAATTPAA